VIPNRRPHALLPILILVAALTAGCSKEAPAPAADNRLLVVDGIVVTMDDVAPYLAFLDSFLPEGGRKAKLRRVLEEHLLPLRLAERAFPEQRREQLARAEGLVQVATNAAELEERSQAIHHRSRHSTSRLTPRLPVAMFLFDQSRWGSVSEPIEVPNGYIVATVFELKDDSALALDDYVDALQVGFLTHEIADWMAWLDTEQRRIGDHVTYVHPDYREAMPEWLHLPKLP
jgi:hypothetical protein